MSGERLEILGAKASLMHGRPPRPQQACPHAPVSNTHVPSPLELCSQLCQLQGPIQNPRAAANKALNQGSYQHTYLGPQLLPDSVKDTGKFSSMSHLMSTC